jgi:hypothetical protein
LAAAAGLDRAPQLIEACWPVTTVALLAQREGARGLSGKQVEVVILAVIT